MTGKGWSTRVLGVGAALVNWCNLGTDHLIFSVVLFSIPNWVRLLNQPLHFLNKDFWPVSHLHKNLCGGGSGPLYYRGNPPWCWISLESEVRLTNKLLSRGDAVVRLVTWPLPVISEFLRLLPQMNQSKIRRNISPPGGNLQNCIIV
jgi:hypothetical protein